LLSLLIVLIVTEGCSSLNNSENSKLRGRQQKKNNAENNNRELQKNANKKKRTFRNITVTPVENIFIQDESVCNDFQDQKYIHNITTGSKEILRIGNATFGERFKGLRMVKSSGLIGMKDTLYGSATGPLDLTTNWNSRENLYVQENCLADNRNSTKKKKKKKCGIELIGRTHAGIKGPGSISALFDSNVQTVNIDFKSDGAVRVILMFYKRNGRLMQKLGVNIMGVTHYNFKSDNKNVAGIAMYPQGSSMSWQKFSVMSFCFK